MEKHKIQIIKGLKPVLLSAPHTCPIIKKQGNYLYRKPAERRVAEMVRRLCEETNSWGLFIEGKNAIRDWENIMHPEYRSSIATIVNANNIALFMEVHGSDGTRPFALDYDFLIPSAHSHDPIIESLILKHAKKHFSKNLISNGFFRQFNGKGEKTFTYFVRKKFAIPAIQFELNKNSRQDEKEFKSLINILQETINEYHDNYISQQ